MVKYYFEDKKNQEKLKTIMDSWIGTPYRHRTGEKGRGCDCIHFVGGVFDEIGLFKFDKKKVPEYARDWHLHSTREILSDGIKDRLKVEKKQYPCHLINGDIILSHYSKASAHAGIFFENYVYQAIDGIGVRKINISDKKYKSKMKFVFRILS